MFTVPSQGRRDCDFDVPNPGPNSCLDGGCVGGLECDPQTGTVRCMQLSVTRVGCIQCLCSTSTSFLRKPFQGVPPATLAEFNLGATDNYDGEHVDSEPQGQPQKLTRHYIVVSIVDGYNLPMKIINDAGCPTPSCPVDLGPNCECSSRFDSRVGLLTAHDK